jgi:hypothetical protein
MPTSKLLCNDICCKVVFLFCFALDIISTLFLSFPLLASMHSLTCMFKWLHKKKTFGAIVYNIFCHVYLFYRNSDDDSGNWQQLKMSKTYFQLKFKHHIMLWFITIIIIILCHRYEKLIANEKTIQCKLVSSERSSRATSYQNRRLKAGIIILGVSFSLSLRVQHKNSSKLLKIATSLCLYLSLAPTIYKNFFPHTYCVGYASFAFFRCSLGAIFLSQKCEEK